MRRCNSTGQGRSRILPRGRTIGAALERRNRVLVGMFEWLCRGVGRPLSSVQRLDAAPEYARKVAYFWGYEC